MILAKPVIANRYWILKDDDKKVGQVEVDSQGVVVKIGDSVSRYKTIPMVRKKTDIEFKAAEKLSKPQLNIVHGYATGCRAHNAVWDIKRKIPLFTKTAKSKSWFAAGFYKVKQHRTWKTVQNPKLIVLDRYPFQGPFYTKEEANDKPIS